MDEIDAPQPQDAPRLNEHDEITPEYERLVDLVLGARPDAIQAYNEGNNAAGIRMRKTLVQIGEYAKHLRLDSIALAKGEERPVFDWGVAEEK